jgi:hypothetical protein
MTEIKFIMQIIGDAKRRLIVRPEHEAMARAALAVHDPLGLITLDVNPICPEGKMLLIDEPALAASEAQFLTRRVGIQPYLSVPRNPNPDLPPAPAA